MLLLSGARAAIDGDSLMLADRDQHLVLYTARQGSRDAESLALLNVIGTASITG